MGHWSSVIGHSRRTRGATMLVVLMFIIGGTVALTAWLHLTAARLQQAEQLGSVMQRQLSWENSVAINRQYSFVWAFRDNVTHTAASAVLPGGWGDASEEAFSNLQSFGTTQRASSGTVSFPFNNLRVPPTSDSSVFFERADAFTDKSKPQRLVFYNYLKTYTSTLLGDLFVVHKRPTGAIGSYSIAPNFQVNGRVVIYDGTADTSSLRAASVMHARPGLTNTTKNLGNNADLLPENYPVPPVVNSGYGGTSSPTAVTNGALNLNYNPDFPPGSFRDIITKTGNWMTGTTTSNSSTNVDTDENSGSSFPPTDFQVRLQSTPTYPPPTSCSPTVTWSWAA